MIDNNKLFAEYTKNPTRKLRDRIFQNNLGLIYETAHNYRVRCVEPLEDLIQLASIGMLTAITRFDLSRGTKFNGFAAIWMKHEIRRHIRDKSSLLKIPRPLSDLYERGKKLMREYPEADDSTLAEKLAVDVLEWRLAREAYSNRLPFSLNATICVKTVDYLHTSFLDGQVFVMKEVVETIEAETFSFQNIPAIAPVKLDSLDPQLRQIANLFFFEWKPLAVVKHQASGIPRNKVRSLLQEVCLLAVL